MADEQFAFWFDQFGFNVVEVDALQRLLDVELARLAFVINTVPIEHAIRGVAVLLDLDEKIAFSNRMQAARR